MIPGFQQFPEGQIIAFALIFLRIVAFVFAWPVFGDQVVPVPVRILLALVLTVTMAGVVPLQNVDLIKIGDEIVFLSLRELFVGLVLGFMLRFFFYAVSISGELIGLSAGLTSAQIYNPAMGSHGNILEQFNLILATLFLLALNGHHLFLQGLAQSFELVPIADIGVKSTAFAGVAEQAKTAFLMGIKMAAPVIAASFVANVTMGVVGRAVPQMNVFMTSLQVTIFVGLGVLFISMPLYVDQMNGLLTVMADRFFSIMKVL